MPIWRRLSSFHFCLSGAIKLTTLSFSSCANVDLSSTLSESCMRPTEECRRNTSLTFSNIRSRWAHIRLTINMSLVTFRPGMAVYKTKGLPVHLSTAESIGGYFECKLNCSRIRVRRIPAPRVTSNKILPDECPRTLKYYLGPLLKMHAALFDVIRDGTVELVDANVGARPTTQWWPPIAAHRSIIVNNARAHKIYGPLSQ